MAASTALAQVPAPSGAASAPPTQTITVTGERAGRTLAETTSSVTVLPEAEVRRRGGKQGVYGVIDGAPNYTPSTPEELPPIRGERSSGPSSLGGGFLFGSTTRASLIVDDVARITAYSNASFQSIFDLDQVELLRGPQTTVRGANAIAGAFVVKTKDPTRRREGEAMLQADHNAFSDLGWRWAAMGNAPLTDALSGRVVVERRAGRTPVEVFDGSAFDPGNPAPPPGTDLEALSKFDRTVLRTKLLYAPPDVPELDVLVTLQAERARDLGFDSYVNGPLIHGRPLDERKYVFGFQRIFDTKASAFIVNAGWQLGGNRELRLIASTQRDRFSDALDANEPIRFAGFDESLDTVDLLYRFGNASRGSSAVSGVLGATASRRKQDAVTTGFALDNRQRSTSRALFGDLVIPVAAGWQLLAGARLHDERGSRRFDFGGGTATVDDTIDETLLLPKLGVAWQIDAERSTALTWRRGYNPGGSGIDFVSLETFRFDSERADVFELSYRHAPRGAAWNLSANLFANRFDDKQFQYSPSPNSFRIVNYPKARSHGAEFEGQWQATPALRVAGGLGLLRTRIGAGDPALEGNRFGEDPNATVSVGLAWQATSALELSARAQRIGRYYSDFQNDPAARAGGYATLDLGAAYSVGAWTLRAFLDNATDRLAVGRSDGFGGYLLPPRTVGLSASVRL